MIVKVQSIQDDVRNSRSCPHAVAAPQPLPPPLRRGDGGGEPIDVLHRAPADVGPVARARSTLARFVAVPVDALPSQEAVRAVLNAALGEAGLE